MKKMILAFVVMVLTGMCKAQTGGGGLCPGDPGFGNEPACFNVDDFLNGLPKLCPEGQTYGAGCIADLTADLDLDAAIAALKWHIDFCNGVPTLDQDYCLALAKAEDDFLRALIDCPCVSAP